MKQFYLDLLRCVDCGCDCLSVLRDKTHQEDVLEGYLTCTGCGRRYLITGGVPDMSPTVERLGGAAFKQNEMLWYNEHISPRPDEPQNLRYGSGRSPRRPGSHTDMYNFHLNRMLSDIRLPLKDALILDLGCGAGQEAEFLARVCGARVVGIDIASTAVSAALERSHNFGYSNRFDGIAGDMEMVPFRDNTLDICLVHTSLHHCTHPFRVLSEMARVAKLGILITSESCDSFVIRLARRLGLTTDYEMEASGNKVWRPLIGDVRNELRRLGFQEIVERRHFMNTSCRIRWGKLGGRSIRPFTSFLESELLLALQDTVLGKIGNTMFFAAIK